MALKDAFVNVAQAAATSMARSAVNSVVSGVAAGLKGANPQNAFGGLAPQSRQSPIISYPDDVAVDPMQGHYILFGIRTNEPGKVKPNPPVSNLNVGPAGDLAAAQQLIQGVTRDGIEAVQQDNIQSQRGSNSSLTMSKRPSTKLVQSIALYMPPQVSVSYNANYAETEITRRAEAAVGAFAGGADAIAELIYRQDFGAAGASIAQGVGAVKDAAKGAATQAVIGAADKLLPGTKSLVALQRGKIITPRMEVMFEGIGRRSFEFTFIMIPKSASESQKIKEIVKLFKVHMSPKYSDSGLIIEGPNVREQSIPDVFDINYMYRDKENSHINKIGTSYLTGMDVNYGGDRYTAYEPDASGSPPPQRTTMTLRFTEIELMYRNRVEEGY